MRRMLVCLFICLCLPGMGHAARVMSIVTADQPGLGLLQNGGFEDVSRNVPDGWNSYELGFSMSPGQGIDGSNAVLCENMTANAKSGIVQSLTLNRSNPMPLIVSGWSRAQDVSGSPDNDYSIYLDITYQDGTYLWGQTGVFSCGTHGWQKREFVIFPSRAIKSVAVYCLFRGHTGRVWFDNIVVKEMRDRVASFENAPVEVESIASPAKSRTTMKLATKDGLQLSIGGNTVTSLKVGGRELAAKSPSGFLARDVAANSDVYSFDPVAGVKSTGHSFQGACPELGLSLRAEFAQKSNCILVMGRLTDTRGEDRAVTLSYALPIDADAWRWGDYIRSSRVIYGGQEYAHTIDTPGGATGKMSNYPLSGIYDGRTGIALAVDMAHPALYRLEYNAGTHQYLINFDFGLVQDREDIPGSVSFAFLIYRFDPRWGFRAAYKKLTDIFPSYFFVRSKDQGIWMPFTDVSKVQGWQDFGFKYHEGDNNLPFDNAHGILGFRYSEPSTWWMPMGQDVPRTLDDALEIRESFADGKDEYQKRLARATKTAGITGPDGSPVVSFLDTPWCDGALWSLNPSPYLKDETNDGITLWNAAEKARGYSAGVKAPRAGEYLDSLEGYYDGTLNFNREHFRWTTVPPVFDLQTRKPVLLKGLSIFEFTKWISDDLHKMGKLVFANAVPYRYTFLCPWLDVLGTETNWMYEGKYRPDSDEIMSLRRMMCGKKPYLTLMNTEYDAFTSDLVEKYLQRSLFYGIFPSMFSHNASENVYWENPKWYNRDRPLFKKYIPLVKRLSLAGWEPITLAVSSNPGVYVERFGKSAGGLYFTLMNDTDSPQTAGISIDVKALNLPGKLSARELISSQPIAMDGGKLKATLAPQEVWLVQIGR